MASCVPLTGLVALSLAFAACGGDDATSDRATATAAPSPAPATATAPAPPRARPSRGGVALRRIGSFSSPTYVTAPPGDNRRVFVVEQGGRIMVVRGGRTLSRPFLDLRSRVAAGGERGLLSMVFAPDYTSSRRFYVDYTDRAGNSRIVEYRRSRRSADRADPSTRRQVMFQTQPEANHNGGQLQFGPDGLLYIAFGDGGGGGDQHGRIGNAQDLGTRLGKILRIDPRARGGRPFRVPADNPFQGRAGALPEVFDYGLRNPWRFSFDRRTGDMVIADVGQNEIEEVDFRPKDQQGGVNYGWRVFEGDRRYAPGEQAPGAVGPVMEKRHADGWCSITGGYVVRDPAVPALDGWYVYGDYCRSELRAARLSAGGAAGDRALGPSVSEISSFGEDARGRVYVASLAGPVYRLVAR